MTKKVFLALLEELDILNKRRTYCNLKEPDIHTRLYEMIAQIKIEDDAVMLDIFLTKLKEKHPAFYKAYNKEQKKQVTQDADSRQTTFIFT